MFCRPPLFPRRKQALEKKWGDFLRAAALKEAVANWTLAFPGEVCTSFTSGLVVLCYYLCSMVRFHFFSCLCVCLFFCLLLLSSCGIRSSRNESTDWQTHMSISPKHGVWTRITWNWGRCRLLGPKETVWTGITWNWGRCRLRGPIHSVWTRITRNWCRYRLLGTNRCGSTMDGFRSDIERRKSPSKKKRTAPALVCMDVSCILFSRDRETRRQMKVSQSRPLKTLNVPLNSNLCALRCASFFTSLVVLTKCPRFHSPPNVLLLFRVARSVWISYNSLHPNYLPSFVHTPIHTHEHNFHRASSTYLCIDQGQAAYQAMLSVSNETLSDLRKAEAQLWLDK